MGIAPAIGPVRSCARRNRAPAVAVPRATSCAALGDLTIGPPAVLVTELVANIWFELQAPIR
jgi:hypothetical protein